MSIKTYKHLTKTNYAGIATKIKEAVLGIVSQERRVGGMLRG